MPFVSMNLSPMTNVESQPSVRIRVNSTSIRYVLRVPLRRTPNASSLYLPFLPQGCLAFEAFGVGGKADPPTLTLTLSAAP